MPGWLRRRRLNRLFDDARRLNDEFQSIDALVCCWAAEANEQSAPSVPFPPRYWEYIDELKSAMRRAISLVIREPLAALALLDLSKCLLGGCLRVGSLKEVVGAGMGAALAAKIVTTQFDDVRSDQAAAELGRLLGPIPQFALHAAAKLSAPSLVCQFADLFLCEPYVWRNLVQVDDSQFLSSWDYGSGFVTHGAALMDEDDMTDDVLGRAELVAQGEAWLSDRQRSDMSAGEHLDIAFEWLEHHQRELAKTQQFGTTVIDPGSWDTEASWPGLLSKVDYALLATSARDKLSRAMGLTCLTPIAAMASDRDIVYLAPSLKDGVAVRFFGGDQYRREPEVATLNMASRSKVDELVKTVDHLFNEDSSSESSDADVTALRSAIGEMFIKPMLERWPDMDRVALIPVGDAGRLPISSSLVDGRSWAESVDVTVDLAPSSIFVAANSASGEPTNEAVILGDPGGPAGSPNAIPWVAVEVRDVAAAYGRRPDLLVEYDATAAAEALAEDVKVQRRVAPEIPDVVILGREAEYALVKLEDARVVHLACHGFLPPGEGGWESDAERSPALLLAGHIPYQRLLFHRLARGSCVVLSACSVGRHVAGSASLGVPSALLAIGASSVIASLWPVPDSRETASFMVDLHRHLSDGVAPATALTAAAVKAQELGYPYAVWGGFNVYGT